MRYNSAFLSGKGLSERAVFINALVREGFSLLASIKEIPQKQQERIDKIVYFLRCIALGPL